ncbi:microtubule-associated protein futsch-like isoform X2 [Toxorhynchites rutilus septentrionalis]|nr:microtubule-associated protein futsch-like isoform X2 [Toxorhynchites rutilus septentrionalis]
MPITTPKVPDGLPELMRGLAKSVIKENPENLYVHAAEYFDNLVRERDGELNKGYKNFSAYRDYSDYKGQSRAKRVGSGGEGRSAEPAIDSTAVKGDGEENDSGGSASSARANRRKHIKKQGSKDSSKSREKENVPGSADSIRSHGNAKMSSSKDSLDEGSNLAEEDSPVEKDVEQVMVKVQAHAEYQASKDKSVGKMLSVDSEVAANTVSSVLHDTVLESDEANRETGELDEIPRQEKSIIDLQQPINCEDLSSYPRDEDTKDSNGDHTEDFGTAPSTAEIVENTAEQIQEETCDVGESEDSPKNSDEVDLSVKEDTNISDKPEGPPVNGSVDKGSDPLDKTSDVQPQSDEASNAGMDTVDSEGTTENIIQPRFSADEEEAPEMPDVPSEEPGAGNEPAGSTIDDAQNESKVERLSENSHEEENADQNAVENSEPVESLKDQFQKQSEKTTQGDLEMKHQTSKDSIDTEESIEQNDNVAQEKRTPLSSAKQSKSGSLEKAGSGDRMSGENGHEVAPETSPKDTENEASASESNEIPKESSVTEEKINSSQESVQEEDGDGMADGSVEKTSEEEPKDESISKTKENDTGKVTSKESSRAASAEIGPSHAEDSSKSGQPSEDKLCGEDPISTNDEEGRNSPKKTPSIDESLGEQKETDLAEEASNEQNQQGPEKIAEKELQLSDANEQSSAPAQSEGIRSKRSVGSVEEMEELKTNGSPEPTKVSSVDKTESELIPSPQQSDPITKESSAKESADDTSAGVASGEVEAPEKVESSVKESVDDTSAGVANGGAKGPEEADDVIISSRMDGDKDENEPQPETHRSDSAEDAELPEPSAPPPDAQAEDIEETKKDSADEKPTSPKVDESVEGNEKEEKSTNSNDGSEDGNKPTNSENQEEQSENSGPKDEALEEPCVQRQVSSSSAKPPNRVHSSDLEHIKSVDLTSLNKDSAEALFYSLKKSELEVHESSPENLDADNVKKKEEDDDADVVVGEEVPSADTRPDTKRTFTDDFLEESPITEEAPEQAEGDGVANDTSNNDAFNPIVQGTARSQQVQDQIHSREEPTQPKPTIRRSMTEWRDLSTQDTDYVDPKSYEPDYVEDEDQFDGYYIGNIRNKILASSVSLADSDGYDAEQADERIDDNNVRTALETIASTDTESTLASQTTIQANRGFLRKGSQSTNIPYASFGNNAINQSLDDYIEREEQAASKIQRSYRRFQTRKGKLLRDYHSTMRTFTEDQSSESFEDFDTHGIIKVKMDQKRPAGDDDSFENIRAENRRRPMYSLNIDENDAATRRTTLVRGVAMQRNSTADEDSGKSGNASGDKPPVSAAITEESPVSLSDTSDDKKSSTSGDEKENKDNSSSRSS